MKLGLITFIATLHDSTSVENSHYGFIRGLKKDFDISFIDPEEADYVDLSVVFIASGGTEGMFRQAYDRLPKPVILITDGLHNSLAASIEILTWIKNLGDESEILHGDIEYIVERLRHYYRIRTTKDKLTKSNIGLIGFPSNWLISSDVSYSAAKRKWGVSYRNIEFDELDNLINDRVYEERLRSISEDFVKKANGIKEASEKDISECIQVYLSLKYLCEEHQLDAVTLKCYDLIERRKATGCLAGNLLNNEGILFGCEGDCQAVFSMLLAKHLTETIPFQANPSCIDRVKNEMILAHCSVATNIVSSYTIRSHFESRMGVGIQGEFEPGRVTIFKCGGHELDRYFVSSGELLENLDDPNMCRTQVRVRLDEDVNYFFKNPLANHHLLIPGDHTDIINDFMNSMECTRIK